MTTSEEQHVLEMSNYINEVHADTEGAWDTFKILGTTLSNHKNPNCYVCGIYKCCVKLDDSAVSALYKIVLIDMTTYNIIVTYTNVEEALGVWIDEKSVTMIDVNKLGVDSVEGIK